MTPEEQPLASRPILPRSFDPTAGEVVRQPERAEPGFWVGAPSVVRAHDRWWLTYRERRPRGLGAERGWRAAIAVSVDGIGFDDVWEVRKDELGTSSMERFALVPEERGWTLYLSFVDPADGRWRIDAVAGPDPARLDVGNRRPVLTAASTGTEGVKDPVVVRAAGVEHLFGSLAAATVGLRPDAHATEDIYNVGATTHPTGLATRTTGAGEPYTWEGVVLAVGDEPDGWDRYQARIGAIVEVDGGWVGFYDGSASHEENYEERLGLATSPDLRSWTRRTPDRPWLEAPGRTGSVRYVSAHRLDGAWRFYAEVTRVDGAHELRVTDVEDDVREG